jgi:4-diphosphocytidyl-2-C-methyl-D-erythritol kinase
MSRDAGRSVGRRWQGRAPAKVNLFLRILTREAEGHHQIETCFQALELSDRVTVEVVARPGIDLEVEGIGAGELGPSHENLAVRAAREWLEAVRLKGQGDSSTDGRGIRIHLQKAIPHGGGLGGGSSDAAAVLRGLDELHGHPLGVHRLARIGAVLGADVPFFVLGRSRALGWGRGDRLLPLPPLPVREVVVGLPGFGISTPWAYGLLAERRSAAGADWPGAEIVDLDELDRWESMEEMAENHFQAPLESVHRELALIREGLVERGARPTLLSGSGSAVFGVAPVGGFSEDALSALARAVPGVRWIRTRTLGGGKDSLAEVVGRK